MQHLHEHGHARHHNQDKRRIPRILLTKSASLSLSGLFAEDATGFNQLIDHQIAGDLLYVIFTNVGSGSAANAGDEQFDVSGYITSLEQSAGVETT